MRGASRAAIPATEACSSSRLLSTAMPARSASKPSAFACAVEGALSGEDDPRAEQMVEKQVARCDLRSVAAQDDHASQSARRRGGRGLPGMVRLHRAERHERVGAPAQRLGDTELELA